MTTPTSDPLDVRPWLWICRWFGHRFISGHILMADWSRPSLRCSRCGFHQSYGYQIPEGMR